MRLLVLHVVCVLSVSCTIWFFMIVQDLNVAWVYDFSEVRFALQFRQGGENEENIDEEEFLEDAPQKTHNDLQVYPLNFPECLAKDMFIPD